MRGLVKRGFLLMVMDVVVVNAALICALLLRTEGSLRSDYIFDLLITMPIASAATIGYLIAFKLYNRIWEHAGWGEMLLLVKAATYAVLTTVFLLFIFQLPFLPRSAFIIFWGMVICGISVPRLLRRLFHEMPTKNKLQGIPVLIVGAGAAGVALAREIQSNNELGLEAMAFVDDDPKKVGKMLLNLPIRGDRYSIPSLVEEYGIMEIIITMPSKMGPGIREIVDICEQTAARLKILPPLYKNYWGSLMSQVRRVNMEDLLGRKPVRIDMAGICEYINGKTVLVTGGGGSIGSELCRQIAALSPKLLIVLDNCENNLFDIEMELNDTGHKDKLVAVLIDVKHGYNVEEVFLEYHPQVVFHAAAYKHVSMMERYPEEALWNNVVGSLNTAEMADKYGSEAFILISTDKAVNPTSIMGATKRLAELVVKDFNWGSQTRFAVVRFGNVLGSRGSVIPIFEKQIERGGPVTVTHPDMQRYFMTIPEAVGLVIQAGAMARGGEIFVLDMGEPVKIADLAYDLIRYYGYKPGKDIDVIYTGIRPGEKLSEELFYDQEEMVSTAHERIFISSKEVDTTYVGIHKKMTDRIKQAGSDRAAIVELISSSVPEFHAADAAPAEKGVNVAYLANRRQKGDAVIVH